MFSSSSKWRRHTGRTIMAEYKEYVCTLDEKSLKRAKEELNENPADRMSSVENFRKLIQTRAPHLICSLGKQRDKTTSFLLLGFNNIKRLLREGKVFSHVFTGFLWTTTHDALDLSVHPPPLQGPYRCWWHLLVKTGDLFNPCSRGTYPTLKRSCFPGYKVFIL